MKKKIFISFVCLLVMIMFPFIFTGCNELSFSPEDVDLLYNEIKKDSVTSQFYSGDNVIVNFDNSLINTNDTRDKSYIFDQVYRYYLSSSTKLFSTIVNRIKTPSFVLKNFDSKDVTIIYNNLKDVQSKLKIFAESKIVYEQSEGHLYFKDILNDYNNLISSFYNFNNSFANAYFNEVGKVDFSTATLSDSNLKDMLCYQLMLVSQVSFKYELVSFKSSNPLGEINTWYNSTTQVKSFVTLAGMCLNRIDSNNLTPSSSQNSSIIKSLFVNMQTNAVKYNNEYDKFSKALQNCNPKLYLSSENKKLYLENCAPLEKSSLNIIQNFLDGRYNALKRGLTQVVEAL